MGFILLHLTWDFKVALAKRVQPHLPPMLKHAAYLLTMCLFVSAAYTTSLWITSRTNTLGLEAWSHSSSTTKQPYQQVAREEQISRSHGPSYILYTGQHAEDRGATVVNVWPSHGQIMKHHAMNCVHCAPVHVLVSWQLRAIFSWMLLICFRTSYSWAKALFLRKH